MISKIIPKEVGQRSIINRSCIEGCITPPPCFRIGGFVRFQDLFIPSVCKVVNIPDAIIAINIGVLTPCSTNLIISQYVISQCNNPCTSSITNNMFTIFQDVYGDTDVIQLDPNGCCNISRILWEAAFNHIPITQENDTNWLRLCFIENGQFPSFIAVPPLDLYNWAFSSDIIRVEYGDKVAAIAPLSRSECFVYVEAQNIRWIFPDDNAIICNEFRREKIDMIWAGAACICIGTQQQPPTPIDPFNLKEDYEVLTGLTIGADLWESQQDIDTLTKIIISRSI